MVSNFSVLFINGYFVHQYYGGVWYQLYGEHTLLIVSLSTIVLIVLIFILYKKTKGFILLENKEELEIGNS